MELLSFCTSLSNTGLERVILMCRNPRLWQIGKGLLSGDGLHTIHGHLILLPIGLPCHIKGTISNSQLKKKSDFKKILVFHFPSMAWLSLLSLAMNWWHWYYDTKLKADVAHFSIISVIFWEWGASQNANKNAFICDSCTYLPIYILNWTSIRKCFTGWDFPSS